MPAPRSVAEIARLIDHALLHPTLTDADLRQACVALRPHGLASICIKPCAVSLCADILHGTPTRVCTVIGFPHGSAQPEVKAYEAATAFRDGAEEIDMVCNIGRALGGDWQAVRDDIAAVLAVVRRQRGVLKVIFETDYLPDDAAKIRLCGICSELRVDFVKTSTGFGFVRGKEGGYDYAGATDHDLTLMRRHTDPSVGVKASGGVRDLARALAVAELGCTRIGTSSTEAILREAHARFGT